MLEEEVIYRKCDISALGVFLVLGACGAPVFLRLGSLVSLSALWAVGSPQSRLRLLPASCLDVLRLLMSGSGSALAPVHERSVYVTQ